MRVLVLLIQEATCITVDINVTATSTVTRSKTYWPSYQSIKGRIQDRAGLTRCMLCGTIPKRQRKFSLVHLSGRDTGPIYPRVLPSKCVPQRGHAAVAAHRRSAAEHVGECGEPSRVA